VVAAKKRTRHIMTTINRTTQQDRDRKSIAAIQKYLMQLASMLVAGVAYTPAQFIALLQKDIDLADAASNAREDLRVAAEAARQQRATMTPILVGFRAFLENMFTDPSTIAEFGFLPRTRSKPTAETTAVAVNKRAATRAARHTMGSKQKLPLRRGTSGIPPRFGLRAASAESP
jgi:hypothetical protein